MSTGDNQRLLNDALASATESADPKAEIGLVLLHYNQAIMSAVQNIETCAACAATVDISRLKAQAAEIQRGSHADYQGLHRAVNARLGDTVKLCEECQLTYQRQILSRFVQLHRSSSNPG